MAKSLKLDVEIAPGLLQKKKVWYIVSGYLQLSLELTEFEIEDIEVDEFDEEIEPSSNKLKFF